MVCGNEKQVLVHLSVKLVTAVTATWFQLTFILKVIYKTFCLLQYSLVKNVKFPHHAVFCNSTFWTKHFFHIITWTKTLPPSLLYCQMNALVYDSVEITNKTQPCNRIYYSTVRWRLNMFRAAYRSSSGALTVFAASGLHTHVVTGRSQVWVGTQTWLRPVTTCVRKPEAANTVRAPDDERRTARNMLSL